MLIRHGKNQYSAFALPTVLKISVVLTAIFTHAALGLLVNQ
jgi:hypothetical protein